MKIASRPLLRRLAHLHRLIGEGNYPNATTMALELEVATRTIYRDLDFLRDELNAPLEFCARNNGYYFREGRYALPLLELTEGELVALFLAERVMQHFRGSPFVGDLAAAYRKLTAGLPQTVSVSLEHLAGAYSVRVTDLSVSDARQFAQLVRATREGRQLEIVYWTASRDAEGRRVVDPYHLVLDKGEWYLLAYCHLREEVRMFVPGRIRSSRETGKRFEKPESFVAEDYLDGSFRGMRGDGVVRRVRLLFSSVAAKYVREKVWHSSQKLRPRKDGRLELTMRVSHLLGVKQWVLSHGAECEVLEPAELRELVAEEMWQGLKHYGR